MEEEDIGHQGTLWLQGSAGDVSSAECLPLTYLAFTLTPSAIGRIRRVWDQCQSSRALCHVVSTHVFYWEVKSPITHRLSFCHSSMRKRKKTVCEGSLLSTENLVEATGSLDPPVQPDVQELQNENHKIHKNMWIFGSRCFNSLTTWPSWTCCPTTLTSVIKRKQDHVNLKVGLKQDKMQLFRNPCFFCTSPCHMSSLMKVGNIWTEHEQQQ